MISIVAVKRDFAKIFSAIQEIVFVLFVNCERTVLFSVKHGLHPPLSHPQEINEENTGFLSLLKSDHRITLLVI